MTELLNGCSYSDLWVSPINWKSLTSPKQFGKMWYVECKYYDPRFKDEYPSGFPYRKKLNKLKTFAQRKRAIEIIFKTTKELFEIDHYNPILGQKKYWHLPYAQKGYMSEKNTETIPTAIDAINARFANMDMPDTTAAVIGATKKKVVAALSELGYGNLKITEFNGEVVTIILQHISNTNGMFNSNLAYLSMILIGMVKSKLIESNPTKQVQKLKTIKKLRRVISIETIKEIFAKLKESNYELYRYAFIFFHSGARGTEMLRVQAKNVDLENQEYVTVILKDSQPHEVLKIILPEALPYWREIMSECESGEYYLFGESLKPSLTPYKSKLVTKKWRYYVKDASGGIYQLKHRLLSYLEKLSLNRASGIGKIMASHKDQRTTDIYLIDALDERNEALKSLYFKIFPPYEVRK